MEDLKATVTTGKRATQRVTRYPINYVRWLSDEYG